MHEVEIVFLRSIEFSWSSETSWKTMKPHLWEWILTWLQVLCRTGNRWSRASMIPTLTAQTSRSELSCILDVICTNSYGFKFVIVYTLLSGIWCFDYFSLSNYLTPGVPGLYRVTTTSVEYSTWWTDPIKAREIGISVPHLEGRCEHGSTFSDHIEASWTPERAASPRDYPGSSTTEDTPNQWSTLIHFLQAPLRSSNNDLPRGSRSMVLVQEAACR
jgi:hypothetical protein